MAFRQTLGYLAVWSAIGAALFSLFVVYAFRSGLVYNARKKDGTLKESVPRRGYVSMGGFLLVVLAFFFAANYLGLARNGIRLGFGALFALNYGLYLILFVFDTLVIDWVVLGIWRPAFLKLPDEIGLRSMAEHIKVSIPAGLAIGTLLVGLVTLISFFTMMNG